MSTNPKACRFCGHEPVEPDAPACPSCGRVVPNPGPKMQLWACVSWMVIILAIAAIGAYFAWRRWG